MNEHKAGNMTRPYRRVLVVGFVAGLGACASGVSITDQWVQAYPGARRAPQEVATIVRGWGQGFPSRVDGVNYGSFRGLQLRGIEILPGEHTVTLECDKKMIIRGQLIATPSTRARFVAGHSYLASCRDDGKAAAAVLQDAGDSRPELTAPRPS